MSPSEDLAVGTGDERALLLGFLAYHRRLLRETIEQLCDEEARLRLVPSATTPLGLLKHAAFVDTAWSVCRFGGISRAEAGIDGSFELEATDAIAALARAQEEAGHRADAVIAKLSLEDTCEHPEWGTLSLRWVLTHCIREIAQHCGHAEILVEQIIARRPVEQVEQQEVEEQD